VLIDWFTVIAQLLNFLVLVALLKYFLYGRIIRAMDEREQKIATRLAEAEQQQKEAEREAASYHRQQQELAEQHEQLLAQARAEADQRRQELVQQVRAEVDRLQTQWRQAIQRDQRMFLQELRRRAAAQIVMTVRRILADLANEDLEQRVAEVFLERLQQISKERPATIRTLLQEAGEPLVVQSAFDLPQRTQQRIEQALRNYMADNVEMRSEIVPEMVCGIALARGGQKVGWSVTQYLADLEEHVSALLEEATHREAAEHTDTRQDTQEHQEKPEEHHDRSIRGVADRPG
jgi:F-type H+-transporting ATPase subunit b